LIYEIHTFMLYWDSLMLTQRSPGARFSGDPVE
jgi:hypothetical protein